MIKNNDLTEKQARVLECIQQSINQRGFPPTIREICDKIGLSSTSTVYSHLIVLEKKGYIRRDASKNRAIEIISEECNDVSSSNDVMDNYVMAPIIGTITAGSPIFAEENIDGYFPVPVEYLGNEDVFFLRVRGDSMHDAGILNRDLALIKKQSTAKNGEIVAALLDDNATIKTFYKENGSFRLQPENSEYSPIYTNSLEIMGVLIGIIRMMKKF